MQYLNIVERIENPGETTFHVHEPYAVNWERFIENGDPIQVKILKEQLKDKIVIDLGGGITDWEDGTKKSVMQKVAYDLGAGAYVNVDKYLLPPDNNFNQNNISKSGQDISGKLGIEHPDGMGASYVHNDILLFLAQMKEQRKGIVFALNGIDVFMVSNQEYHRAIAEEIARVLPSGGIVLTCDSDATKYFPEFGIHLHAEFKDDSVTQVWVKD